MWLLVGLGNPGPEYSRTRHNVGFKVIEALAKRANGLFPQKTEHKAFTGRITVAGESVLLAQPQTYMNLSGESVASLLNFYKIPLDHLVVIHDEIDLPFGRMKFQRNRGAGGHNGLKSVNQMLGTMDYVRLKFGVGRPPHPNMDVADYVLQSFNTEESTKLSLLLDNACGGLESLIKVGLEKTANVFNQDGGD